MNTTHLYLTLFTACFLFFIFIYQWVTFGLETAEIFLLNVFVLIFITIIYTH